MHKENSSDFDQLFAELVDESINLSDLKPHQNKEIIEKYELAKAQALENILSVDELLTKYHEMEASFEEKVKFIESEIDNYELMRKHFSGLIDGTYPLADFLVESVEEKCALIGAVKQIDNNKKLLRKVLRQFHALKNDLTSSMTTGKQYQGNTPQYLFHRDGDVWKFVFNGYEYPTVKHVDGFSYIQYLLKHPNKEISAYDLYHLIKGGHDVPSSPYNQNDSSEIKGKGLLKNEIPFEEYDQSLPGSASSELSNKARSNITKRINFAIRRIDNAEPDHIELCRHLINTIEKGCNLIYYPGKSDFPAFNWTF